MKKRKQSLTSLDDFIDQEIGNTDSEKRKQFEKEYESFKIGVLIKQARKKCGLTQNELADLVGTNKSYISKLERDLKDVRFSTLQKIVQEGLGGQLVISIDFDEIIE